MNETEVVKNAIGAVLDEFRKAPNVFLTEDDVRANLYSKLLPSFGDLEQTKDGDYSIPLHLEVRWYGNSGALKLRSDIALIEVSTLKTLRHMQMPSKGYYFDVPKAIIEIKFRRPNGKSDKSLRLDIMNDLQRLEKIQKELSDAGVSTTLWLLVLDKKAQLDLSSVQSSKVTLFYHYADKVIQAF